MKILGFEIIRAVDQAIAPTAEEVKEAITVPTEVPTPVEEKAIEKMEVKESPYQLGVGTVLP